MDVGAGRTLFEHVAMGKREGPAKAVQSSAQPRGPHQGARETLGLSVGVGVVGVARILASGAWGPGMASKLARCLWRQLGGLGLPRSLWECCGRGPGGVPLLLRGLSFTLISGAFGERSATQFASPLAPSMSSEPWCVDFRHWRIRRSGLEAVQLHLCRGDEDHGEVTVWWELRQFAGALGFAGQSWRLCVWWRKYEDGPSLSLLEAAGFGPSHIRPSRKSAQARAVQQDGEGGPEDPSQEMMVTTQCLLLLLARWANFGPATKRANATAMVHDDVSYVAALRSPGIRRHLGVPRAALRIECSRPPAAALEPCRHCADIEKQVGRLAELAVASAQWQAQTNLLITLVKMQSQCAQVQVWLRSVAKQVALSIDAALSTKDIGQNSPEGLPQPRGGSIERCASTQRSARSHARRRCATADFAIRRPWRVGAICRLPSRPQGSCSSAMRPTTIGLHCGC